MLLSPTILIHLQVIAEQENAWVAQRTKYMV